MSKIITINDLTKLKNKDVSLAHGVFDVFHIGHKRYLEQCKKKSKVLIVSITSDKYVNKGPGRPIFNQHYRSELISALSFVDFVIINDDLTPINLIKKLKPKFYFKGKDYSDLKNDLTGNIIKEKSAVEDNGGKIVFIDDIVFSSSSIINKTFGQHKIIKYLTDNVKDIDLFKKKCLNIISKLEKLNIAVIGEIIFDRYIETKELSKPSKENILAVESNRDITFFGGALASAITLSKFCNKVDFYSAGKLDSKSQKKLKKYIQSIKNLKLINDTDTEFHSITKKRFLNNNRKKLFEVYDKYGSVFEYKKDFLLKKLKKNIKKYDLVIACDFGHGLINEKLKIEISKNSKFFCLNTQANADNRGFNLPSKYKKCDFLCLDIPELRLATGDRYSSIEFLASKLKKQMRASSILITMGEKGLYFKKTLSKKDRTFVIPGFETNPIDTMGAGDVTFSLSSILNKVSKDEKVIAFLANLAGAIKTNIYGHEKFISKQNFIKSIDHLLK